MAVAATAATSDKQPWRLEIGSIYDYKKLRVIGEGAYGVVI
ncbi:hypothetical protein ACP4OV_011626 [Aristida adscensionis]